MTPQQFIEKWQRVQLTERSACQQHFLDLCEVFDWPKPAEADPDGSFYTFERGVKKSTGGNGWADVWLKNHFGWEYKRKHRSLEKAYDQLLRYREDLGNPPLLIVSDMDRFEVHTNFTGTVKTVYAFDLDSLPQPENLAILKKAFSEPESLKPGETTEAITARAAETFATLADGMRDRGVEPHTAAHFLMKLMFCMFAEDVNLLPDGLFTNLLDRSKDEPERLNRYLADLFEAMTTGGDFWGHDILYFNGGLFADAEVVELNAAEIRTLEKVNDFDWSNVEPSIFGTMFERTLDPAKRSQIGAHYTSREDIETLLVPVVMSPLRREWNEVKEKCKTLREKIRQQAEKDRKEQRIRKTNTKAKRDFEKLVIAFVQRLSEIRILDPACGSGNFLYVSMHLLLDLEKEVISYAAQGDVMLLPLVRPTQLYGIEINKYAQELAQVVIWIGFLQWMHHNGFQPPRHPVLEPFDSIQNKDAILDLTDPENPTEPEWPEADFIVGNPPFLGAGSPIRSGLGDSYVDALMALYSDRLPGFSDLCCYWFEKSRSRIERCPPVRAGLLATQGIRGGANRKALIRIKESGDLFFAIGDRNWILDGAAVHVSMVGFDDGREKERSLNGCRVDDIPPDLSLGTDVTAAKDISRGTNLYDEGVKKGARFNLTDDEWSAMIRDANPNGRPNSDIIRPYINGNNLYKGSRPSWIIYIPADWTVERAAAYEAPFEFIKEHVFKKYGTKRKKWWVHERARPDLIPSLRRIPQYFATVRHSKHRIFVWLDSLILPDSALGAFARDTHLDFGLLHSRPHEVWSLKQGTQVRERESGFRYTPTSCLDTFPFPEPSEEQQEAIARAARELDRLRNNWLTPLEWTREELLEFFGSVDGPWSRYVTDADDRGIGTVQYPRLVPKDEEAAQRLKKRTLTNLYNERPTWLDLAHSTLDEAVFAAYGWDPDISDDELLAKLLELNLERAAEE